MNISIFLVLIVQLFFLNYNNCIKNDIPDEINSFYLNNKDKDFKEFLNWKIYPRDADNKSLIFDFYNNDEIQFRFFVINDTERNEVIYKQVFPNKDTLFYSLKNSIKDFGYPINIELYKNFRSLKINALYYLPENSLILFKMSESISLIYSEAKQNITEIPRFNEYKKIDSHWFYYSE
ncbi:MAG: hypothetical protein JXJ22_04435 [Bacteroidales bacterium]|nr:hypothetical protein [Bacteroidales bacterium]